MGIHDYRTANQALWDHWASLHPESDFYQNEAFKGHQMSLNSIELDVLPNLSGKRVLHLQCHFGQDTISLHTLGANEIVGLDFSAEAVKQARILANDCGVPATFVQRDVLEPIQEILGSFDLVFASYGVVGWHPDVSAWMDAAFSYLKPGGELILVDFHPVLWILDSEFKEIVYSYFNRGVITEESDGSYAAPLARKMVHHTWNHTISDLIKPIVDVPERSLVYFMEHDWSPYELFESTQPEPQRYQIKGKEGLFPLVYAIKAQKINMK